MYTGEEIRNVIMDNLQGYIFTLVLLKLKTNVITMTLNLPLLFQIQPEIYFQGCHPVNINRRN